MVPRGQALFTYRFNEAVCSGGVPVLITGTSSVGGSYYVPPFDEFVPFTAYGVLVREQKVSQLLHRLQAIPEAEVQMLREAAQVACKSMFVGAIGIIKSLEVKLLYGCCLCVEQDISSRIAVDEEEPAAPEPAAPTPAQQQALVMADQL